MALLSRAIAAILLLAGPYIKSGCLKLISLSCHVLTTVCAHLHGQNQNIAKIRKGQIGDALQARLIAGQKPRSTRKATKTGRTVNKSATTMMAAPEASLA